MKKTVFCLILCSVFLFAGISFGGDGTLDVKMDTYGHGLHSDQYGNPVELVPLSPATKRRDHRRNRPSLRWFSDPTIRVKEKNAYGPGIHMDQYGRPVEARPIRVRPR